jgi:hypothetical protein
VQNLYDLTMVMSIVNFNMDAVTPVTAPSFERSSQRILSQPTTRVKATSALIVHGSLENRSKRTGWML